VRALKNRGCFFPPPQSFPWAGELPAVVGKKKPPQSGGPMSIFLHAEMGTTRCVQKVQGRFTLRTPPSRARGRGDQTGNRLTGPGEAARGLFPLRRAAARKRGETGGKTSGQADACEHSRAFGLHGGADGQLRDSGLQEWHSGGGGNTLTQGPRGLQLLMGQGGAMSQGFCESAPRELKSSGTGRLLPWNPRPTGQGDQLQ